MEDVLAMGEQTRSHGLDLRHDFPALHQEVHGYPLAYLDNAATTQKPTAVLQAMDEYYRTANSNVHRGVHELSRRATALYEDSRSAVQTFIGAAQPEEVVFTKGCTEAVNLVAHSWGRPNLKPGDRILLSTMEHHANIVPWQIAAQATGAVVEPIPITDSCELDLDALARMLDERVKLVGVKHVCNATGTVNPIAEVVALADKVGAKVLADGAQALAHVPVDVQAFGVDFYAMSGHKVYGPTGVGGLWARRELLDSMPPFLGGGDMVRTVSFEGTTYADAPAKFEAGTPPIAETVGWAAAIRYLQSHGVEAAAQHESKLAHEASRLLLEIPGVRLVGTAANKSAIVSFVMDGVHPHDIGTVLDQHGVAVRAGHHCCMPLMKRMGVPATVRASFALYNRAEDVQALVEAMRVAQRMFA